jgi:hypothetical protein
MTRHREARTAADTKAVIELKTRARLRLNAAKAAGESLRLRDCLNLVAKDVGFTNWDHARRVLNGEAQPGEDLGTFWYAPRCAGLLIRAAFYLIIFLVLLAAQMLASIESVWALGCAAVISFFAGLLQFSAFPDFFIGARLRKVRETWFRTKLSESEFLGKVAFRIDWVRNELSFTGD